MIFATKIALEVYILNSNCMNGIYLIIGGNMGEREKYLFESAIAVEKQIGKIIHQSSIYETASWGNTAQRPFLNQVLYLKTVLSARQVLENCLAIEKQMGRVREIKWGSRTIDIDILFYNEDVIQEDNLKIPHPFIQDRKFVLVPFNEIAPDFIHPVLKKTIHQLLIECKDSLEVTRFN